MPYHLHFADDVWSATAKLQYHEVYSDDILLHVYLEIDSAYHDQPVWGPWSAVTYDQEHLHVADDIVLTVVLDVDGARHYQYSGYLLSLGVGLIVADTYHLHTGSDPFTTWVYPNDAYHVSTIESLYIIVNYQPGVADADIDLPSLEVSAHTGLVASIELPSLTVEADLTTGISCEANVSLSKLTGTGYTGAVVGLTLEPLEISATALHYPSASADIVIPKLTANATASGTNIRGSAQLPALQMSATGYAGVMAEADITFPALVSFNTVSMGIVATANIQLPWMQAVGTSFENITADFNEELPSLIVAALATTDTSRYCSEVLRYSR